MGKLKRQRLSKGGVDRLSQLSDDLLVSIFSLMPTLHAARTVILSHRFRHLWKACPVISMKTSDFRDGKISTQFIPMLVSAIAGRDPSIPLLRLHLQYHSARYDINQAVTSDNVVLSLLVKADSLGLRHLTLDIPQYKLRPMLPTIFTFSSLESLSLLSESLSFLPEVTYQDFPTTVVLTCLRSLSLGSDFVTNTELSLLISKLSSLEALHIWVNCNASFDLSSQSIRHLRLTIKGRYTIYGLKLDLPTLELLELKGVPPGMRSIPHSEAKPSFLKKVIVSFKNIFGGYVSDMVELLHCLSHAEELHLELYHCLIGGMPHHILIDHYKAIPVFVNLNHLEVTTCFHRLSCKDVVNLLHNSPALRSVKLFHKEVEFSTMDKNVRNCWRSKLPRNADGNFRHSHISNLHLEDNKIEFMKLLCKNKVLKLYKKWKPSN